MPISAFVRTNLVPILNEDAMTAPEMKQNNLLVPQRAGSALHTLLRWLVLREDAYLQQDKFTPVLEALEKCSLGLMQEHSAFKLPVFASLVCAKIMFGIFSRMEVRLNVGIVFHFAAKNHVEVSIFLQQEDTEVQTWKIIKLQSDAPSPNERILGGFCPNGTPRPEDADDWNMDKLISLVKEALTALPKKAHVVWATAIFTGPIQEFLCGHKCFERACLENHDMIGAKFHHSERKETMKALHRYMAPIGTLWPYRRLPHAVLREFQNQARCELYHSLSEEDNIEPCEVVANSMCKMGKDCTRMFWDFRMLNGTQFLKQVQNYDPTWLQHEMKMHLLVETDEFANFVTQVDSICAKGKVPVIPMDAAFLQFFKNPQFHEPLLTAVHHTTEWLNKERRRKQTQRQMEDRALISKISAAVNAHLLQFQL